MNESTDESAAASTTVPGPGPVPAVLSLIKRSLSTSSCGIYNNDSRVITVYSPKKSYINLGFPISNSTTNNKLLYIEEALLMLERGYLELLYNNIPVTIQEAYTLLIQSSRRYISTDTDTNTDSTNTDNTNSNNIANSNGLYTPFDSYITYSNFKYYGYIVRRATEYYRKLPNNSNNNGTNNGTNSNTSSNTNTKNNTTTTTNNNNNNNKSNNNNIHSEAESIIRNHIKTLFNSNNNNNNNNNTDTDSNQQPQQPQPQLQPSISIDNDIFCIWSPSSVSKWSLNNPIKPDQIVIVYNHHSNNNNNTNNNNNNSNNNLLDHPKLITNHIINLSKSILEYINILLDYWLLSPIERIVIPIVIAIVQSNKVTLYSANNTEKQ